MRSDLYARKSNKDQARSVDRQERFWRADCAALGVTPGRTFVDPHFSASRYAKKARPDYEALLEWIRGRNSEMVSVWEVTRTDRQMGSWVYFLDLCRDMGVLIRVFGDDDPVTYDPRRQRDREQLLKEGIAAEAEVEKLRARVRNGILDTAHLGRPPGPLLFGYRRVYGAPLEDSVTPSGHKRREVQQVIDAEKAKVILKLAKDTLAGVPLQRQANLLNDAGVPTASGRGLWKGGTIRNLLLNAGYQGHRVLGGLVVTENAWPAILDPATAGQLRAMLEQPGRRNHADPTLVHQLSGAMLCGKCRRTVRAKNSRGVPRYQCTWRGCLGTSAFRSDVDAAVDAIVKARLLDPGADAAFTPAEKSAELSEAEAELEGLERRLRELVEAAGKPDGPSAAFLAAAERRLRPQIDEASARVRRLRTPPVLRGYDRADLVRRWSEYPVGERRLVISSLAEVVLSPATKSGPGAWSWWRLAESRWHGDDRTWGDVWRAKGLG
ncbi:recombinase family protein [Micromonospora sp. FIMYZ51]|uniref:recombinase family protein n=1 Tax=Micromonospora sp. FIMYZ51 TaxID=3051832 RepID=UPI00311F80D1